VIYGVNFLSSVLKDKILKFQASCIQNETPTATVVLVFTRNIGTEVFAFLTPKENISVNSETQNRLKAKISDFPFLKRIEGLT
jgi:hypothetical protein